MPVDPTLPPRTPEGLNSPSTFVFAGRITRDKGVYTLIEAVKLLSAKRTDFIVEFVGNGDALEDVRWHAEASSLTDHVRFRGRLAHAETIKAFERAIAIIAPSLYQDPAPYIPLEAASRQVVSIVSSAGGLPFVGGPHCLVFQPGNSTELAAHMARILDDPGAALRSGRDAYCWCGRQFSGDRVAYELLREFDWPSAAPTRE